MNQRSPLTLASPHQSALVVIDIQTRLNAAMAAECRTGPVENGSRLLRAASILEVPVLHTEQYPKGLGPTEPALAVELPDARTTFAKTCFSCYAASGFAERSRTLGRTQMILFGIEAHVCVLQTACDLLAAGYQVFVVEDAICSRRISHRDNALARMRHAGVIVTNVESVLFEWVRDATHGSFKRIAALLK